jgi:hypothetical protein
VHPEYGAQGEGKGADRHLHYDYTRRADCRLSDIRLITAPFAERYGEVTATTSSRPR